MPMHDEEELRLPGGMDFENAAEENNGTASKVDNLHNDLLAS